MRILLQKRVIFLLSLLSIICFVGGYIIAYNTIHCYQTGTSGSGALHCGAGTGTQNAGPAFASILGFIGFIALVIAWVAGLVKTTRVKSWLWFAIVFVIPPVGSLLYGLFGPSVPPDNAPTFIEGTPREPVTT